MFWANICAYLLKFKRFLFQEKKHVVYEGYFFLIQVSTTQCSIRTLHLNFSSFFLHASIVSLLVCFRFYVSAQHIVVKWMENCDFQIFLQTETMSWFVYSELIHCIIEAFFNAVTTVIHMEYVSNSFAHPETFAHFYFLK